MLLLVAKQLAYYASHGYIDDDDDVCIFQCLAVHNTKLYIVVA